MSLVTVRLQNVHSGFIVMKHRYMQTCKIVPVLIIPRTLAMNVMEQVGKSSIHTP